jgi:hypothetical protein
MKKFSLPIFLLALTFTARAEICHRQRSDIQNLLSETSSRINLRNGGGLFNAGVCWWHSRLQRASLFLAQYDPSSPAPTKEEARRILNDLRSMRVVTIPGHANFHSFTTQFPDELQKILNLWQKNDGVFHFSWIRGISGTSSLSSSAMQRQMDRIFRAYLASPVPIWIMAQIKGITAHSMLIKKMEKTSQGHVLWVVDSNRPLSTLKLNYKIGDRTLFTSVGNYTFVPYLGFQRDFRQMISAVGDHCGRAMYMEFEDFENLPLGDLEL